MKKAIVSKIRPVTWKICVQGEESAQYVRSVLEEAGCESTDVQQEIDLHDPGVYSFIATPKGNTPLSAPELVTLLQQDESIEVTFTED